MAYLRGRAASPIRPGTIVKNILLGNIPLESRTNISYVSYAAVTDLHNTYKEHIRRENMTRESKLRGMSYHSFATWFRFAKYLGLVEKVKEEPANVPSVLSRIVRTTTGRLSIRRTSRVLYGLTAAGIAEERAWQDLTTAWKDNWELGQPALKLKVKIPEFEKVTIPDVPYPEHFVQVAKYLRKLILIAHLNEEAREEIYNVAVKIRKWLKEFTSTHKALYEQYEDTGSESAKSSADELQEWIDSLQSVYNLLTKVEIEEAADMLEEMGSRFD